MKEYDNAKPLLRGSVSDSKQVLGFWRSCVPSKLVYRDLGSDYRQVVIKRFLQLETSN